MRTIAAAAVLIGASVAWPGGLDGQLRYDRDYPAIPYSSGTPTDAVATLVTDLGSATRALEFERRHGYLGALLEALGIPVSSQVLVFSDTSLQMGLISAAAPRAIYFDDESYVAWVQDTDLIEIASMDPRLGPVFYTIEQDGAAPPRIERQTFACLECHDTYGLTGGGVPRFLIGSGPTDGRGRTAAHGAWQLTTPATPIIERWGGWYVTGTHGRQRHLGNLVVHGPEDVVTPDLDRGANRPSLDGLVGTDPYLSAHSDIVALLVLEHQIHVQNVMTQASWEVRSAPEDPEVLARASTALADALLMVGEAPLSGPVRGTSDFAREFRARGPDDAAGRSLREFDLTRRVFRYPVSYLVYSEAFDALPPNFVDAVFLRIRSALEDGGGPTPESGVTQVERLAALEILEETRARFPRSARSPGG